MSHSLALQTDALGFFFLRQSTDRVRYTHSVVFVQMYCVRRQEASVPFFQLIQTGLLSY